MLTSGTLKRPYLAILIGIVSLIPVFVTIHHIHQYGQPIPFGDEWDDSYTIATRTEQGTLTVRDLFRQHNDSRTFFTHVLTAASTVLFDWNLKLEMIVNASIAFITLVLLVMLYRHTDADFAVVLLPFSALVYALTQYESWLWAIQSAYFFMMLFIVLMLWVINVYPPGWKALMVAGLCALCATFSFANGLLVWFVMLPMLWLVDYRRPAHYALWIAMTVIGLGAYFNGFIIYTGDVLPTTVNPITLIEWIPVFVGTPMVIRTPDFDRMLMFANLMGIAGLLVFIINVIYLWSTKRPRRDYAVWVILALFVLASGFMTGYGRAALFGRGGAMAPRYATLQIYFWIANVALSIIVLKTAWTWAKTERFSRWMADVNVIAATMLLVTFIYVSINSIDPLIVPVTPETRACLEAYPTTGETACLSVLHPAFQDDPPPQIYTNRIETLHTLQLATFSHNADE